MSKLLNILIAAFVLTFLVSSMAVADPLPGQILKFQQKPMVTTPIDDVTYLGHDEWSTLYETEPGLQEYHGTAMADDFADEFDTPVLHVKWWGSYQNDQIFQTIDKFLIAFESDVPADPSNPESFSHPDHPILSQVVTRGLLAPASGTFTETKILAGVTEEIYEYNAELKLPFDQQPGTVYWLKIAALVDDPSVTADENTVWGWHNRDYTVMNPLASAAVVPGERDERPIVDPAYPSEVWHFQDDAVSADTWLVGNSADDTWFLDQTEYQPQHYIDGLDGPGPGEHINLVGLVEHGGIGQFSKDLAFELYTVPEPATLLVLALGLIPTLLRPRKRRA